MTATLERDTLKIPEDALERLREAGLTDGSQFEIHVEEGRLIAVFVSHGSTESEEGALAALREAQEGWGPGLGHEGLLELRALERSRG